MVIHVNIDWATISILWYFLDGLIFCAAIFALWAANEEKKEWKSKRYGGNKWTKPH